jgi:hypothetical protein
MVVYSGGSLGYNGPAGDYELDELGGLNWNGLQLGELSWKKAEGL